MPVNQLPATTRQGFRRVNTTITYVADQVVLPETVAASVRQWLDAAALRNVTVTDVRQTGGHVKRGEYALSVHAVTLAADVRDMRVALELYEANLEVLSP